LGKSSDAKLYTNTKPENIAVNPLIAISLSGISPYSDSDVFMSSTDLENI